MADDTRPDREYARGPCHYCGRLYTVREYYDRETGQVLRDTEDHDCPAFPGPLELTADEQALVDRLIAEAEEEQRQLRARLGLPAAGETVRRGSPVTVPDGPTDTSFITESWNTADALERWRKSL